MCAADVFPIICCALLWFLTQARLASLRKLRCCVLHSGVLVFVLLLNTPRSIMCNLTSSFRKVCQAPRRCRPRLGCRALVFCTSWKSPVPCFAKKKKYFSTLEHSAHTASGLVLRKHAAHKPSVRQTNFKKATNARHVWKVSNWFRVFQESQSEAVARRQRDAVQPEVCRRHTCQRETLRMRRCPRSTFERLCVVENAQTNTAGPSSTTVMTVFHWTPAWVSPPLLPLG